MFLSSVRDGSYNFNFSTKDSSSKACLLLSGAPRHIMLLYQLLLALVFRFTTYRQIKLDAVYQIGWPLSRAVQRCCDIPSSMLFPKYPGKTCLSNRCVTRVRHRKRNQKLKKKNRSPHNVGPFPMGTDSVPDGRTVGVCPSIRNGHLSKFRPSPK